MERIIFAGIGVTATIRHNAATKQRGKFTSPLMCEERIIGAWSENQMQAIASMLMTRKLNPLTPIIASQTDILFSGAQFVRVKLIT